MDIPARCRDENGYLIRQSLMTDIPYGCRTAAEKGCGFMAVYNAARYFAQPVTESEVWQFFHDHVFLRGVMGTTVGHVCRGVYRFGMKVRPAIPGSCGITPGAPATMCWCAGVRTAAMPSPTPPRRSPWAFRIFIINTSSTCV